MARLESGFSAFVALLGPGTNFPGSPTASLPSGSNHFSGPVLLRFRCLIGRTTHRTIVAMIYTESKYKHNLSPPPHYLFLPPLPPMSCTSLPRQAPPLSPRGGNVVCGDDVASSVQFHLPRRTLHDAVRRSAHRWSAEGFAITKLPRSSSSTHHCC